MIWRKFWRQRPLPATAQRLTIEEEACAKAQAMLLPVAEDWTELTTEKLEGARDALTHWWQWQLKARIDAWAAEAMRHAHTVASAALSQRLRRHLLRHTGKVNGLHDGIGGGAVQDTELLARRTLTDMSFNRLLAGAVGLTLAVILWAVIDFAMVQHLIHDEAVDPLTGEMSPEQYWQVMAVSTATVAGYTLASIIWHWRTMRLLSGVIYGLIFAWLAKHLAPGIDEDLQVWAWWGLMLAWTSIYTIPGLLLIICEQSLVWVCGLLRDRSHAAVIVAAADAHDDAKRAMGLLAQQEQDTRYIPLAVTHVIRRVCDLAHGIYVRHRDTAGAIRHDPSYAPEDRQRAHAQYERAQHCLDALNRLLLLVLALSGLLMSCSDSAAQSQPQKVTREALRAKGKAIVIPVDVSGSSPATNVAWLKSTSAQIDEEIRGAEIGATVTIFGCGDNMQSPEERSIVIQHRNSKTGRTKEGAIAWAHARLLHLQDTVQPPPHQRSELVGCFVEATRRLNPNATANSVIFITDGIERSAQTDCYETKKPCKLQEVSLSLPTGTKVLMRGCGIGLPAARAMELQAQWLGLIRRASVDKARAQVRS
jgi:hypothetical protein